VSTTIRPYTSSDWPSVWDILRPILRAGETYAIDTAISEASARRAWWTGSDRSVFVAVEPSAAAIVGTYNIHANQLGPGSHVCNCGYVVAQTSRGQGIASALCENSQAVALSMDFLAMQFNAVAATSTSAVELWKKHGFNIVGTLPGAFHHPTKGRVNAYVMFKELSSAQVEARSESTLLRGHEPRGVVDLARAFGTFDALWTPKIAGELNGQHIKIAKFEGEFVWHSHALEDELFLVVEGHLSIHLRDSVVELSRGQFYIVARGVEHKPVASDGAHVLLLEPATTINTGNDTASHLTQASLNWT
jgi:mannose-6-phosphate isomerase-like protein (cupin superfamily)/ribosomal protein S18 acetylase RimI-like enzyme